jgi:hypothetical protein
MFRCKITHFFFNIFPLKAWQSFLIRYHIQRCPDCQKELASTEDVRSLFIREDEAGSIEEVWPALKAKFSGKREKKQIFLWPRLRWIAAVAGLFAVVAIGVWLYFSNPPDKSPEEKNLAERFRINYIRVENKPAKAFLFRPHDSKMIIIWAEKNS